MPKPGVMLYFDVRTCLKRLTTEQKGQLFEAILDYGEHMVEPDFENDIGLTIAWDFIRPMIDRDNDRYEEISKKRSKAASKKWDKADANASNCMQVHANAANACNGIQMDANACNGIQMDANAQDFVNLRDYEQKPPQEHGDNLHKQMQMHANASNCMQVMPTTTTTTSTPTPTTPSTSTTTTTTPPLSQAPKNPASQMDFEKMRSQKIEMLTQQQRR